MSRAEINSLDASLKTLGVSLAAVKSDMKTAAIVGTNGTLSRVAAIRPHRIKILIHSISNCQRSSRVAPSWAFWVGS